MYDLDTTGTPSISRMKINIDINTEDCYLGENIPDFREYSQSHDGSGRVHWNIMQPGSSGN